MSLSKLIHTITLAIKSLLLHKLRSGLTMLGIVFGVFSVIAMLSIGEGASAQAEKQVLELGGKNIIIRAVKPPQESANQATSDSFVLRYGLLRKDHKQLKNLETVTRTLPIREASYEARYRSRKMSCRLVGCTPDYFDVNRLVIGNGQGRLLSDQDGEQIKNVVVLGYETAQTLFPYEDPLGETIIVNNQPYSVVGITQDRTATASIGGSLSGQDFNKDIYIPLQTFRTLIGDLVVQRVSGSYTAEEVQLNQITLEVNNEDNVLRTADIVRSTLLHSHKKKRDYAIIVPQELLKQAEQIRQIFNIVLGSIAAISLVVGGIGIMNIMLATVTERTREIGIRRALGAKRSDIVRQFLTETIVLSGCGGIIGINMGLSTPYAFGAMKWVLNNWVLVPGSSSNSELSSMFMNMEPQIAWWSLLPAFGISVFIGVVFGVYPAQAAAKLDPIEALRHE